MMCHDCFGGFLSSLSNNKICDLGFIEKHHSLGCRHSADESKGGQVDDVLMAANKLKYSRGFSPQRISLESVDGVLLPVDQHGKIIHGVRSVNVVSKKKTVTIVDVRFILINNSTYAERRPLIKWLKRLFHA